MRRARGLPGRGGAHRVQSVYVGLGKLGSFFVRTRAFVECAEHLCPAPFPGTQGWVLAPPVAALGQGQESLGSREASVRSSVCTRGCSVAHPYPGTWAGPAQTALPSPGVDILLSRVPETLHENYYCVCHGWQRGVTLAPSSTPRVPALGHSGRASSPPGQSVQTRENIRGHRRLMGIKAAEGGPDERGGAQAGPR